MGRMLLFIVSMGVLGYVAYTYATGGADVGGDGRTPQQKFEAAKAAAKRIEEEQQKRVEDVEKRFNEATRN